MGRRMPDNIDYNGDLSFDTLKQADPDRFLAASKSPLAVREKLMVLYRFNLEIARAPWASSEPMIAEMRLQWWLDAVADIYGDRPLRGHELLAPLANAINQHGLPRTIIDKMITARRFDIYNDEHANNTEFVAYINATTTGLIDLVSRVLDVSNAERLDACKAGFGIGLANLLRAAPELMSRGRKPLPSDISKHIEVALNGLDQKFGKAVFPAVLSGWRARATLKTAQKFPDRIPTGLLGESPAWRRFSFEKARFLRRI